ncbi:uncharacterized protein LOC144320317 isoform X1 [Canis aureus]
MTMRRPTVLRSLQMGNNSSLDTCTWKIRRLTFIDHLIGFHAFWFPRVGSNGQRLESGRRTELLSAFMTTLRTKIYVLRMVEQENEKRLGPQCYHRAAEERREQISPQEGGRHKVKFLKASRGSIARWEGAQRSEDKEGLLILKAMSSTRGAITITSYTEKKKTPCPFWLSSRKAGLLLPSHPAIK